MFHFLKRIFGRTDVPLEQFPGVKVKVSKESVKIFTGGEETFVLLQEQLALYGITVVPDGEEADYDFEFWTREVSPGFPIRWGVRLILKSQNPPPETERIGDVGDEVFSLPFFDALQFTAFITVWILDRLRKVRSSKEAR